MKKISDIFQKISKKIRLKNKLNKKPKITADIHEKNSLIISELESNKEIELKIQSLKIGDYLIGNTIIERKTTNDFISSMLNKRLMEQIKQMQKYERKLIIIEGNLDDLYLKKDESKLNPNATRGFILSIITKYKTNIIFTKDYKDTSDYLIILAKQQLKPKTEISLHSRIPKTSKEQKKYILESFPNIGPKKAESLLKKFSNLLSIFNANEKDIKEILKNRTKDFKEILKN